MTAGLGIDRLIDLFLQLVWLLKFWVVLDEYERAVVLTFGKRRLWWFHRWFMLRKSPVLEPGFHLILPFARYDVEAAELGRGPKQLLRIMRVGIKRKSITWGMLYKAILSDPWNKELKEILYRVGVMFRRIGGQGIVTPPYRAIYDWRKQYEIPRNAAGDYADQAADKLSSRSFRAEKTAFKHYSKGRLPPAHIDARARRFAVKIFLVHLYQVMFYGRYGKMPPRPYILDVLGKEREIVCPKWPYK